MINTRISIKILYDKINMSQRVDLIISCINDTRKALQEVTGFSKSLNEICGMELFHTKRVLIM